LRHRAREPVEQYALALAQFALDHVDDQVVGHEVATLHVFLRGLTQRRSRLFAQQVAGRDLPIAKAALQNLRLGSLARARSAEQHDVEH
jgi:hypothetical protein